MVIHCAQNFDFDALLRYWQLLEALESNSSIDPSPLPFNTGPTPQSFHHRSISMATQTQTINEPLVQYPFKTECVADAVRIPSKSPQPSRRSDKSSRQKLFAALENGNPILREPRTIKSPDDLDESELKRCFEILHACGSATDEETSLTKTRETIEEFLEAVFKDWSTDKHQNLKKPVMDFVVREAIAVGKICGMFKFAILISSVTQSRCRLSIEAFLDRRLHRIKNLQRHGICCRHLQQSARDARIRLLPPGHARWTSVAEARIFLANGTPRHPVDESQLHDLAEALDHRSVHSKGPSTQ